MLKINVEMETERVAGVGLKAGVPQPLAYPLLIKLQQLLCDFRSVESQSQAVDVELRDDILQGILEG